MDSLTVSVDRDLDADVATVTLAGELTLRSASTLRTTLQKCLAECPASIVVDLRDVAVLWPPALMTLRTISFGAELRPDVAMLVCLSEGQSDQLDGTLRAVNVYDSVEDALLAAANGRRLLRRRAALITMTVDGPREARQTVRQACEDWELGPLARSAELVTSELVTNAILHAGTPAELEVLLRGQFLHLRVRDGSTNPPRLNPTAAARPPFETGGRGLRLVDVYASGWGHVLSHGGKMVWATLRTRPLGSKPLGSGRSD
jgi:anti-sigma regulatory factor (Ser/Thr protein kinase)